MTDLVQVTVTTLASGGLAAISSYIAIVWKLNARVARLEETVATLGTITEDIRTSQNTERRIIREELSKEVEKDLARIKKEADEANTSIKEAARSLESAKRELIISIGTVQGNLSEFRVSCAENRSKMVTDKRWAEYTKEQAQKWEDFNRMMGKLEGAISRLTSSVSSPRISR